MAQIKFRQGISLPTAITNGNVYFSKQKSGSTTATSNGSLFVDLDGARYKLSGDMQWLGYNPIVSKTNDTPAKWAELGSGYCEYNVSGYLNDQPSQYGMLISYNKNSDVF